jgi:hypothetical protein
MTDNINILLIDRRIRKLQKLKGVLADPEMSELLQEMFTGSSKVVPVAASQPTQLPLSKARRKYKRNGGSSLIERTYESLRKYGEGTSAKELADFMKSSGYKFKAKDANIAVSKALRLLADLGRIKAVRGQHAKTCNHVLADRPSWRRDNTRDSCTGDHSLKRMPMMKLTI